jgi:hypothetical protein
VFSFWKDVCDGLVAYEWVHQFEDHVRLTKQAMVPIGSAFTHSSLTANVVGQRRWSCHTARVLVERQTNKSR